MKARKFIKRDRTTPGRANGTLLCKLVLPALEERYDFRASQNPARAVESIRNFVNRHLPQNPELLTDASFLIEAELRASSGGFRRKKLAIWKFGDELASVFEETSQSWASLDLEDDDWTTYEVEL
jgi:hypothetical protein